MGDRHSAIKKVIHCYCHQCYYFHYYHYYHYYCTSSSYVSYPTHHQSALCGPWGLRHHLLMCQRSCSRRHGDACRQPTRCFFFLSPLILGWRLCQVHRGNRGMVLQKPLQRPSDDTQIAIITPPPRRHRGRGRRRKGGEKDMRRRRRKEGCRKIAERKRHGQKVERRKKGEEMLRWVKGARTRTLCW